MVLMTVDGMEKYKLVSLLEDSFDLGLVGVRVSVAVTSRWSRWAQILVELIEILASARRHIEFQLGRKDFAFPSKSIIFPSSTNTLSS